VVFEHVIRFDWLAVERAPMVIKPAAVDKLGARRPTLRVGALSSPATQLSLGMPAFGSAGASPSRVMRGRRRGVGRGIGR